MSDKIDAEKKIDPKEKYNRYMNHYYHNVVAQKNKEEKQKKKENIEKIINELPDELKKEFFIYWYEQYPNKFNEYLKSKNYIKI